jgi:hypothetical protein
VAANSDGRREIVGLHIGPSEAETFWSGFLKSLARRGLRGIKLVISDAHEGLKAAIRRVFGAAWQRCRGGCQLFCVSRSRETLYVVEGITDYGTSDQGRAH